MTQGAQGRLKGREPVSVVDIGSNSVRLVVYEGIVRSPTVLFNEKILCGLGKGIADTGRLNEKAVPDALKALRRFRALSTRILRIICEATPKNCALFCHTTRR